MRKIKYLIWIFFGLASIFLGTQKIQASEATSETTPTPGVKVVINEVMANPNVGGVEWIELFNNNLQSLSLVGYTIEDGAGVSKDLSSYNIPADGYLVLNKGVDFSFGLNDSGDILKLKEFGNLIDQVTYGSWDDGDVVNNASVPLKGQSIARTPNGHDSDNDAIDFVVQTSPTPGAENPLPPENIQPTVPYLVSPEDDLIIFKGEEIEFSWSSSVDPEGQDITYDFYMSCSDGFEDDKMVDSVIPEINYFLGTNNIVEDYGICADYYWKIVASDGILTNSSSTFSFTISDPVYSNAIVINELYGDPSSGEEWIELYNNSAENVNCKNWILEDLKGSLHRYKIDQDFVIPGFGYAKILKSQSGITLNNDQDGVRLIRPDGEVLFTTPIYAGGKTGWSFARQSNGLWSWTTKVTPGAKNIIAMPSAEEIKDEQEEEDIPKNTTPIVIKTGEAPNYENYLVKITGTVVSTSGNTFYLDDGSGKVKVYIQAATGIDKPEMHTGDIFEITGIVNLYRGVWRILPQKQEDIKLIQAKKEETDTETTKVKTTTKSSTASTAKSSTTTANARSPTKKVASANSQITANRNPTQVEGYKSPFWLEITKALTGLAGIFLIVLLVKIWKTKRESADWRTPIGGNFGDDYT